MARIKHLFFAILGLNAMVLLYLFFNASFSDSKLDTEQKVNLQAKKSYEEKTSTNTPLRFVDPAIAYTLLDKLDIFEVVNEGAVPGANYYSVASGFAVNDNYCDDHRNYLVNHPELVFERQRFVTNYWLDHKLRTEIIPAIGEDLHPEVYPKTRFPGDYEIQMKVDATIIFTHNLFYKNRQVGRQFSCLSQASNHIPGHDKMYRKDYVGQALVDYAKKYESRPSCFGFEKYFPKTWVLHKKDQCRDFFNEFNSDKYQQLKEERSVVYFRKIGAFVHEGKGVYPVTDEEETHIRDLYKNGTLCGQIKQNNLMQYNIHNLLLVENRKFGFRSFMLIASVNPIIAYYHDGYARLSLGEYDPNSKEKKTFVTNIGVNLQAATQNGPFAGMTEEEIQENTGWSMEEFQEYVLKKGLIKDPNWLDNYLRPEFKKVMIHLIRMAQSGFLQKSSVFELYGLDFVMDDELKLWFIEANTMPLINGFSKKSTILMNKMLFDTFEIVTGLLRSRMKRVVKYINNLTEKIIQDDGIVRFDLKKQREEFRGVTKNKFEPEYEIGPESSFHIIIDENKDGTERYSGLIAKDCL